MDCAAVRAGIVCAGGEGEEAMGLWTARENFHQETLEEPARCAGCQQDMLTGQVVLALRASLKPGRKKVTVIIVHDEECWASFDDSYWRAKARRRKDLITHGNRRDRVLAQKGYPVAGGAWEGRKE